MICDQCAGLICINCMDEDLCDTCYAKSQDNAAEDADERLAGEVD
jgi:hypothetical protein